MQKNKQEIKAVCSNRKAHHLYHILESFEAGIALVGTEAKSFRLGKANLKDSRVTRSSAAGKLRLTFEATGKVWWDNEAENEKRFFSCTDEQQEGF